MNLQRVRGFTLLEVIVVLVLLTIAAAVVAPSLLLPSPENSASLPALLAKTREAAVRRGTMVRLRIDRSGAWQVFARSSAAAEPLMSGRISDHRETVDLLFSPLGTCAPNPESLAPEGLVDLDPLICQAAVE